MGNSGAEGGHHQSQPSRTLCIHLHYFSPGVDPLGFDPGIESSK